MTGLIIFGAQYLFLFEVVILVIYLLSQPKKKQRSILVLLLIFVPLVYLIAWVAASFYFNPRPFVVGHFIPIIPHIASNGFPSGHMLFSSAIAAILFAYNRKFGIVAWVIALIVGASRVYAGVHHWLDIVGSVVIVIGTMWMVKEYLTPWLIKTKFLSPLR